jgi:hypothetical protein
MATNLKFRLAEAELKITVPCSACGRDLSVPAPSIKATARGASCVCGAGWHVFIPALAKGGAAYEVALVPARRKDRAP